MNAQPGIVWTPELRAAVRERDRQEGRAREIEIWPDMAPAVLVFMAMQTQWKREMLGGVTGLDYTAIKPTADLMDITLPSGAFHDIQVMEIEALRTLRKKR